MKIAACIALTGILLLSAAAAFAAENPPELGYQAWTAGFGSFALHSRRELQVAVNGLPQKRADDVVLKRDEKGNVHLTKTSSEPNGSLEFMVVNQRAYRLPAKTAVDSVVTQNLYMPLIERLSAYGETFWSTYKDRLILTRKDAVVYAGHACDRYQVTSLDKGGGSERFQARGEICVDPKNNLLVKSNITLHYFTPMLGKLTADGNDLPVGENDAPKDQGTENTGEVRGGKEPFEITLHIVDEVKEIGQVARMEAPIKATHP